MKTHENRALFSKALLKAATCFFLIAGAGMSPVFCTSGMKIGNYTANCNSKRCGERQKRENPSLVLISWKKERPTVPLPILTGNTG
mgnify:CR=1 FL=1